MRVDTSFCLRVEQEYPDYLRDESRRTGRADSISFANGEDDVRSQLAEAHVCGRTVTLQGARTGITGGAVPDGGHILNLSRMTRIEPVVRDAHGASVSVQPGVLLSGLREHVRDASGAPRLFFPPDPTETSASMGGMVSCNASGAQSFFYGPTRRYVEALRVVLADGDVLDLRRGREKADGRAFRLVAASGRVLEGWLPRYSMPDVKNASGYFVADDMDLIDLFIGAEGTLGIVSDMVLRLIPQPLAVWGVQAFLPDEAAAIDFVEKLRATPEAGPVAIEFFDSGALNLLRRQKAENPAFGDLPDMPAEWHTAVYVEFHDETEDAVEGRVLAMSEVMAACGGDPDATWLGSETQDMQRLKAFRHAIPESVNLLIDQRRREEPALTKLGTDLAVPDGCLADVMRMYRADLEAAGLEFVIFGHIGNNHVHVNILPRTLDEYRRGKVLYLGWARTVVGMGGSISAEHGVGKLKRDMLAVMYGERGIAEMRALKALFDPEGILNPGNLF